MVDELHLIQGAAQAAGAAGAMQGSDEGNGMSVATGNGSPTVRAGAHAAFGRWTAFEQNNSVHRKLVLSGGYGPAGVTALAGLSIDQHGALSFFTKFAELFHRYMQKNIARRPLLLSLVPPSSLLQVRGLLLSDYRT